MMLKVIYVGLGGFIGASLRYLISMGASKNFQFGYSNGNIDSEYFRWIINRIYNGIEFVDRYNIARP